MAGDAERGETDEDGSVATQEAAKIKKKDAGDGDDIVENGDEQHVEWVSFHDVM